MSGNVETRPSLFGLIRVPAVITLGITLLRLAGELWGGSSLLFNKTAGGGGALVGISWLIPVFGFHFGYQLARQGVRPEGARRAFTLSIAAIALLAGSVAGAFQFPIGSVPWVVIMAAGSWMAVAVAHRGWPELGRTLVGYALAARVPVAIVMLIAIFGDWGTHYDVPPPNFPAMGTFAKWFSIGLVPQLTLWVAVTTTVGLLAGAAALAIAAPAAPPLATER